MSARVYVPIDASALSVGADEVAQAIAAEAARRGITLELIRNGSRGLCWLEPLVEITTPRGRIGYGPVRVADISSLFDAGWLTGGAHALCQGLVEEIPFLKAQQRLCFARVGRIDPGNLADYRAAGGGAGLARALQLPGAAIIQAVTDSGLRGRGGAAFPAGRKWQTVLEQANVPKYIVCNADEGDSGTFADRMLMEGDPQSLLEGMTIAGLAVGAERGYIYLRIEYPHARRALQAALEAAYGAGLLGQDVLGSDRRFDIELRMGAGAYICGEETSMLESLEGRRGEVRVRPPLPAIKGLFGAPTVVNNVITLASVPWILAHGAAAYREFGMGQSRGTLPIQLGGNIRRGGLFECAFGISLRDLLYEHGGGSASGRPIRTVQIGGPLGAYVPAEQFDLPIDYESLGAQAALLGHGGIVAFDDSVDMAAMAQHALSFCAHESCGKCTPCRIGSTRGAELLQRIRTVGGSQADFQLLDELCDTLEHGSLCGLGGMTPLPVRSALRHFPADFRRQPARQG